MHVSIPVEELEKLEQSRVKLFELIAKFAPGDSQLECQLLNCTEQIWLVANRRDWNE